MAGKRYLLRKKFLAYHEVYMPDVIVQQNQKPTNTKFYIVIVALIIAILFILKLKTIEITDNILFWILGIIGGIAVIIYYISNYRRDPDVIEMSDKMRAKFYNRYGRAALFNPLMTSIDQIGGSIKMHILGQAQVLSWDKNVKGSGISGRVHGTNLFNLHRDFEDSRYAEPLLREKQEKEKLKSMLERKDPTYAEEMFPERM